MPPGGLTLIDPLVNLLAGVLSGTSTTKKY